MTFQQVRYDGILKYCDRLPDHRVLCVMDAYLNRIHNGYNEMARLNFDSQAYEFIRRRVNHWTRQYRAILSYVFAERCWQVWGEHFNRWPNENQALQPLYRCDPQPSQDFARPV